MSPLTVRIQLIDSEREYQTKHMFRLETKHVFRLGSIGIFVKKNNLCFFLFSANLVFTIIQVQDRTVQDNFNL